MRWNSITILFITICLSQIVSGQKTGEKSVKLVTITGKVLTEDKKPVSEAVFYIDNLKTSYKSKSNGSFKIKVSPSANKLMVSAPDFGSCDTIINGQTRIVFILKGNSGTRALKANDSEKEQKRLGSSKKPTVPRAKKMNTYTDIYQMIRGEVNGVVFGSSEPLYVVNGIIVNTIDYISPMEVKSIILLKGSSAAIYGVRGANGVISITLLNALDR